MMETLLLIEFKDRKEEQNLIGQMLMAYGEFEFFVAGLLGYAIEGGNDIAGRLFFRVHGEGARLDVADAILRPFFKKSGLHGQWSNTIGALRYCKDIRNQYAHCNWIEKSGLLQFVNMDRDAASPEGDLILQLYPTDLALLKRQFEYFAYTNFWLFFLNCKCRRAAGDTKAPDPPAPKSIPQPPKNNRGKGPQTGQVDGGPPKSQIE